MHTIEVNHDLTLEIHPGSDGGRPVLKLHSRDAEIARGSQRSDRTCREGVGVGNSVGVGKCSACGGSLAEVQPVACPKCGFVLPKGARFCIRCGTALVGG